MAGEEYPCQDANHRHSAAWLGSSIHFFSSGNGAIVIRLLPSRSFGVWKFADRRSKTSEPLGDLHFEIEGQEPYVAATSAAGRNAIDVNALNRFETA